MVYKTSKDGGLVGVPWVVARNVSLTCGLR